MFCHRTQVKIIFLILFFFHQAVKSEEIKTFLSACGYGTLTGAGLGLASLVFEKKPNESYGNIARGASLGLYGGMLYGWMLLNQKSVSNQDLTQKKVDSPFTFWVFPDGVDIDGGASVTGYFMFKF